MDRMWFRKKRFWVIVVVLAFVLMSGGFMFYLISGNNMSVAANFADDYLRPTIGNEKTLILESYLFAVTDKLKQVFYKFAQVQDGVLDPELSEENGPYTGSMNLSKIPVSFGFSPLPKEGEWTVFDLKQFPGQGVMAATFVRPDPDRSYAVVSLVEIDMKKLAINAMAGTLEPGKIIGNPGEGKVPDDIQNSNNLVAAFNGGFQYKDGRYGMVVGDKVYVPLRHGLGTLVVYKDKVEIVDYEGQDLGKDIVAIRQNGPALVLNGQYVEGNADDMKTWGITVTKSMSTWRSGLGVTKEGNLIYAVGPSLHPKSLADALISAGAVNAIQLDINPFWVRFVIFNPKGNGNYTYSSLDKRMQNGGYAYLNGYKKDFFYLYKR